MKSRNYEYKSYKNLKYGNKGFYFLKPVRFEFSYFNMLKKLIKPFLKSKYTLTKFFTFWIFLTSNFPVTKKSKNSRMGKGKGSFLRWSIKIPYNYTFLEFKTFNSILIFFLFKKLKFILSSKLKLK